MKVVIDTSVAVKLVAPESGQEAAFALIRSSEERLAPQLLLVEAANALWKKVSRGELFMPQTVAGLDVIEDAITRFVDDGLLVREAAQLSIEIGHPVYDCMYLALAAREQAVVVTGDLRFLRKVQPTSFAHFVRPLIAAV